VDTPALFAFFARNPSLYPTAESRSP